MEVKSRTLPVVFAYRETKQYRGRKCLVIATNPKSALPGTEVFPVLYFDAARGQLVGMEEHGNMGGSSFDVAIHLVTGDKSAAPSADTSKQEAPAGGAPPSSGPVSDDDVPVVR